MTDFIDSLPLYKDKLDENYASILAPFATKAPKENSRIHTEVIRGGENRTDFQRDRDRIIHSKAFRRLMYKTQVFVNHEGDHFRTRLTHTLEVSQLARGICKSLALNEELAEAISLGHDLGHTPFGHAVERFLGDELSKREMGNFLHNEQSVRIVDLLEKRCEDYDGLNLTYEVREGILKHNKDKCEIYSSLNPNKVCSTLEGQVVGLVDTIAYICHDLQDAIKSGLIENSYYKNNEFRDHIDELRESIAKFMNIETDRIEMNRYSETFFIGDLIHKLIIDVTEHSVTNLKEEKVSSCEDVKKKASNNIMLISFTKETKQFFDQIKDSIYKYVYGLNTIQAMDVKAVNLVKDLLYGFENNPKLLPPDWYFRYKNIEKEITYDGAPANELRVICDYIATMTDRFALDEHDKLYNPRIKI